MGNHRIWIKITAVLQLLTAAAHSLSFLMPLVAENETEKQLIDLITGYKKDMGLGFDPTFQELFTALSACFPLLYLFGAVLLFYLLKKNIDAGVLKGVLNISLIVFGICFVVMLVFTFPPPILMTGLVFLGLVVSRLAVR
ncbi:MAG: hypothetical protein J5I65_03585 [Aridibacter famidurans]|nr:hypothetical protein [Aridibacter famidurans]